MKLRHIEIFHAVYVNGTVSAAAEALHVSQPAVTKTLKHAEQQLGFPLFDRRGGRLIPTDDAHAIFAEVAEIQSRVSSLRQATRNLRHGTGTLRISAVPSLALSVLPRAVALFLERHPDVFFDLQTIHHDEIGRRLYEREADVAIAYQVPRGLPVTDVWLGEGELGLLYREEEMPDAPARIELQALSERKFISLVQSGPIGDLFQKELSRMDLGLREVASARTFYIASALVREGVGVAVLDNFTAQAATGKGVAFRPLRPSLTFDVHAIAMESRPLSRMATSFLEVLKKQIELA